MSQNTPFFLPTNPTKYFDVQPSLGNILRFIPGDPSCCRCEDEDEVKESGQKTVEINVDEEEGDGKKDQENQDEKKDDENEAESSTNPVVPLLPPMRTEGFPQHISVQFPHNRLAVCYKCKKNFKTREMCRVKYQHTTVPWTTAYVCVTLDESCFVPESESKDEAAGGDDDKVEVMEVEKGHDKTEESNDENEASKVEDGDAKKASAEEKLDGDSNDENMEDETKDGAVTDIKEEATSEDRDNVEETTMEEAEEGASKDEQDTAKSEPENENKDESEDAKTEAIKEEEQEITKTETEDESEDAKNEDVEEEEQENSKTELEDETEDTKTDAVKEEEEDKVENAHVEADENGKVKNEDLEEKTDDADGKTSKTEKTGEIPDEKQAPQASSSVKTAKKSSDADNSRNNKDKKGTRYRRFITGPLSVKMLHQPKQDPTLNQQAMSQGMSFTESQSQLEDLQRQFPESHYFCIPDPTSQGDKEDRNGSNSFFADSKTPVCASCKRTNRTKVYCRELNRHRQLPWSTVFVVVSAKDHNAAGAKTTEGEEECARKMPAEPSPKGLMGDDINLVPPSRTFLAMVSCEKNVIYWLDTNPPNEDDEWYANVVRQRLAGTNDSTKAKKSAKNQRNRGQQSSQQTQQGFGSAGSQGNCGNMANPMNQQMWNPMMNNMFNNPMIQQMPFMGGMPNFPMMANAAMQAVHNLNNFMGAGGRGAGGMGFNPAANFFQNPQASFMAMQQMQLQAAANNSSNTRNSIQQMMANNNWYNMAQGNQWNQGNSMNLLGNQATTMNADSPKKRKKRKSKKSEEVIDLSAIDDESCNESDKGAGSDGKLKNSTTPRSITKDSQRALAAAHSQEQAHLKSQNQWQTQFLLQQQQQYQMMQSQFAMFQNMQRMHQNQQMQNQFQQLQQFMQHKQHQGQNVGTGWTPPHLSQVIEEVNMIPIGNKPQKRKYKKRKKQPTKSPKNEQSTISGNDGGNEVPAKEASEQKTNEDEDRKPEAKDEKSIDIDQPSKVNDVVDLVDTHDSQETKDAGNKNEEEKEEDSNQIKKESESSPTDDAAEENVVLENDEFLV